MRFDIHSHYCALIVNATMNFQLRKPIAFIHFPHNWHDVCPFHLHPRLGIACEVGCKLVACLAALRANDGPKLSHFTLSSCLTPSTMKNCTLDKRPCTVEDIGTTCAPGKGWACILAVSTSLAVPLEADLETASIRMQCHCTMHGIPVYCDTKSMQ